MQPDGPICSHISFKSPPKLMHNIFPAQHGQVQSGDLQAGGQGQLGGLRLHP